MPSSTRTPRRVALCALVPLWVTAAALADEFPYRARVVSPGAPVLAGPGDAYYQTGALEFSDEVEVWEHPSRGYAAVRPPAGSYSWVRKADLQPAPNGAWVVRRSEVPSRIGGIDPSDRDAVHVRLDRGEPLELLGEDTLDGVVWARVAPPAGEFRWVAREHLERLAEGVVLLDELRDPDVQAAGHSDPDPTAAGSGPVPPERLAFLTGLNALEADIALRVAERPSLWRFEDLEARAAQLLQGATSEAERQAVRAAADRMARFTGIAARYAQLAATPAPQGAATPRALPALSPDPSVTPLPEGAAEGFGAAGDYDVVGTLRPVVSKRPDAPKYALVNDRGVVVALLTPGPDLHLQPMVGKRVGVVGSKGYLTDLKHAHVAARSVTLLR